MSESCEGTPGATGRHLWQIRWVRDLVWVGLALAALIFGYALREVFTPVLIALALAYIFQPVFRWLERRLRLSRPAAITLVLVVLLFIGLGVLAWLGPLLVGQTIGLVQHLPDYVQRLTDTIQATADDYGVDLGAWVQQLPAELKQLGETVKANPGVVMGMLFERTGEAFGVIGSLIGASVYLLITAVLIPIYFFFFAWKFEPTTDWAKTYIPESHRERTLTIIGKMDDAVSEYFRGRLIIALLMGAFLSVGWWLAGVPYWFLLGMATGLLNLIPFAAAAGLPVAILLKYLDTLGGGGGFEWMAVLLWPSVVYLAGQFLDGWVLTPWIQSRSLNLSPVTVIIAIFVGSAVAGLYGLLLAIPVTACIKILFTDVILPQVRTWAAAN